MTKDGSNAEEEKTKKGRKDLKKRPHVFPKFEISPAFPSRQTARLGVSSHYAQVNELHQRSREGKAMLCSFSCNNYQSLSTAEATGIKKKCCICS